MKNAGLKINVEVTREDGSIAQRIEFDQRGLTEEQLLELQSKAVAPCANAVMEILARWNAEAAAAAKGKASPSA